MGPARAGGQSVPLTILRGAVDRIVPATVRVPRTPGCAARLSGQARWPYSFLNPAKTGQDRGGFFMGVNISETSGTFVATSSEGLDGWSFDADLTSGITVVSGNFDEVTLDGTNEGDPADDYVF